MVALLALLLAAERVERAGRDIVLCASSSTADRREEKAAAVTEDATVDAVEAPEGELGTCQGEGDEADGGSGSAAPMME